MLDKNHQEMNIKNNHLQSEQIERIRSSRQEHGVLKVLLSFLGSMELAITLFVMVGIASIIGTILQQNQAYNTYIIKFGPFWFEVFRSLELYDIYSSWWFVVLLGFLLISTSACIYHYFPVVVREWHRFRLNISAKSLKLMHSSGSWISHSGVEESFAFVQEKLTNGGYQSRCKTEQGVITIAAKKGSINRLGYLFTHGAIIVICLSALYDGNFNLKLREVAGQLKPETRDLFASQVPDISRLKAGENHAFRGNANVPEGSTTGLVFLQMRNGFLVQELPFTITLNDFRIEHYESGMPKSFESDIVIQDKESGEKISKTIEVNHPLVYKDFAIYQSSFDDGGSIMDMQAWSLDAQEQKIMPIKQVVGEKKILPTSRGEFKLELSEFKLFNIQPNPKAEETGRKFKNMGSTLTFRLRDSSGQATEFINYVNPVEQEGRYFFLSGVRSSVSQPFQYLFIPADDQMSLKRFFSIRALLNNEQEMQRIAEKTAALSLSPGKGNSSEASSQVAIVMQRLADLFNRGGFDQVVADIEDKVPEDKRESVMDSYFKVLQTILGTVYLEVLQQEGVDISSNITPAQEQYYDDMVNTMGVLANYNSPVYLQIKSFEHKQASGFQITKAPGKDLVYLGCILLCIGIVLMFYVAHKRIWIIIEPYNTDEDKQGAKLLIAGSGDRHQKDFAKEFQALSQLLDKRFS
ncbi:MAG: cytochrome c biogenesis protein ResB [gamma proteobacterium symbiont of Taylorina sp.]|nr:cytochrome c biogenesis protein ResB [gamma proteobacterium symbiont of Taylorina sp.]